MSIKTSLLISFFFAATAALTLTSATVYAVNVDDHANVWCEFVKAIGSHSAPIAAIN